MFSLVLRLKLSIGTRHNLCDFCNFCSSKLEIWDKVTQSFPSILIQLTIPSCNLYNVQRIPTRLDLVHSKETRSSRSVVPSECPVRAVISIAGKKRDKETHGGVLQRAQRAATERTRGKNCGIWIQSWDIKAGPSATSASARSRTGCWPRAWVCVSRITIQIGTQGETI